MIQTLVVGSMATNCYIADDYIIDPGDDAEYIMGHVKAPKMVIATHGHFDHIMAAYALTIAYNIPFAMHAKDEFLLTRMQESATYYLKLPVVDPPPRISVNLNDGDTVGPLTVIHTPGHTPGSICLKFGDILMVGDTVFADGGVGRSDFSYSKPMDLSVSVEKIMKFKKGTRILPGHGKEFTL